MPQDTRPSGRPPMGDDAAGTLDRHESGLSPADAELPAAEAGGSRCDAADPPRRFVAARDRAARLRGVRERLRSGALSSPIYRVGVAVVGTLVTVGGLLLVPLPGPGWLIVFVGLGVLASEFVWARRLLRWGRGTLSGWTAWLRAQGKPAQGAVGVITLAALLGAVWAYLLWKGVPSLVPDAVERPLVRSVPGVDRAR